MSILLALDQSSLITGYAIFENGNLKDWGKISISASLEVGDRLVEIRNKISELIDKNSIEEVAFEDIQLQNNVGNNVATYKVLAEVFGVITELLHEKGIKYQVVASSSWKSTLKIKGNTRAQQKKNAQEYVLQNYNIKAIQDTCDAICIGTHVIKKVRPVEIVSGGFDWSV